MEPSTARPASARRRRLGACCGAAGVAWKELDVLLERFARGALPREVAEELRRFEQLLGLPDPVLAVTFWAASGPPTPKWRAW